MQRAPDGIIAAYQGYDAIFARGHATEVGCWAHTRRKFFEAQTSDPARAAEMLVRIGDLYAVEHRAKEENLDREQIKLRRQKESRPILEGFTITGGKGDGSAYPDYGGGHAQYQ